MSLSKGHRAINREANPVENVVYFRDRLINNIELFIGCTVSTFKKRSSEAQDKLRQYANQLEEIDRKCGQVRQGGAIAEVVGGTATLAAVLLAPATGGGSLAVAAAATGAVAGVAGGAASSGASHAKSRCEGDLREKAKIASTRVVKIIQTFHKILIEYDESLVKAKEYLNSGDGMEFMQLETEDDSSNIPGASCVDTITKNFGGMVKLFSYIKGHRSAEANACAPSFFLPNALTNIASGVWNLVDGSTTTNNCNVFSEKLREFANQIEDYTEALLANYEKYAKITCDVESEEGSLSNPSGRQNINAYDMINYISCQLSNKSREAVISELQNDMDLGIIQEWRESIFQVACRTCEVQHGVNGDQVIQARLELRVTRGYSLATKGLGDIVELVSYLSETDNIVPDEMLLSQPVHGHHHREDVVPHALLGAEASVRECSKSTGMFDKTGEESITPSQNITWKGINVYEMITHIICELAIDSKEAVINYLVNDIPLDTLQKWREELFQAACSTYEATIGKTECPSQGISGSELRHGAMSAQEYAKDVIELVLYTAGSRDYFPMDVLCSNSTCTYKGLGEVEPGNLVAEFSKEFSKYLTMHDADTTENKGVDLSPTNTLQDCGVYAMITNLAHQLDIESTDGVVQYLVEEIPLDTIEKWREDIFQVACNTYEANLAQSTGVSANVGTELRLRRGSLSVQDYAEDIVKLMPYVIGSSNRFPLDVLDSQRMRRDSQLESLSHKNQVPHVLDKKTEVFDVVAETTHSDPASPQSTSQADTDIYDVITHIVYQLDIETKQDVMMNLADEVHWERLKAWREELFQEACRTYQIQRGEMGELTDLTETRLQLRRGLLTAEDYAVDVVKLVLYISGAESEFPKQVVCYQNQWPQTLTLWLINGNGNH